MQNSTIKIALTVFLALHAVAAFSSIKNDTAKTVRDSTLVQFFYNDFEKFGSLKLHQNDTSIAGFQKYDPLMKLPSFFATLGNIGSASRNLVPYPFMQNSGFDYGIHSFDPYLYKNDSIRYYRIAKTYTELQYQQGAKKETFLHARFSRNVYRSLNLGFDVRVMNAPGAYLRQRSNLINFAATAQYFTRDKRYGVIANFLLNRIKNNENGGIKYDSVFEQNLEKNREILDINLKQSMNRIRENGFYMKHYLNLSRHPKNANDSAFYSRRHVELGRIIYSFQYNRQVQNHFDYKPRSGFYREILLDSTQTRDSITVNRYINELTWSNPTFRQDKRLRVLQLEAGIRQQYIEVTDHELKKYFIQYIPSAGISFHPYSSLLLTGHGDYVIGDYNGGDLSLRAGLSQTLGRPGGKNAGTVTLKGNYAFQKPGWFLEHYSGNHFRWDTAWKQQSVVGACFEYSFRNLLDAGLSISRIDHYAYLDTAVRPAQYDKEFGYIYAYLNENIRVWRFNFDGRFAYQTVQGANVLRLPVFLGRLGICYTQELFRGAATLQPGFSFNYNTAYFADNYMPAIQSFYLQDRKETGDYLYMDFFLNVKIQRARFFLQYTHFNASFMSRSYYLTPSYPMPDGAFHFGISWSFHD